MEKKNKYLQIYLSIMENEKKMIFRDFSDFSIAGNNWKKNFNYNEKRKKKIGAGIWKFATA